MTVALIGVPDSPPLPVQKCSAFSGDLPADGISVPRASSGPPASRAAAAWRPRSR